jgi:hypothetical protein
MSKDRARQLAVVVSVAATIIVNVLANALPLNGQNTGEISDRFQVFFVPAGYVFSIWFLIYVGLISYAVYQALPAQRENPRLRATGWLAAASGLANIVWLFCWHYNLFGLSLVIMLALLGLLVSIYLRLGIGQRPVSTGMKWAVHVPFSVYLGWITVATIANATDVLDYLGWNGAPLAPEVWAVIMLAAAFLVTAGVLFTRRDVAYALVIVWAAAGIGVKQAGVDLVSAAAWIVAGLVALLAAGTALRLLRRAPVTARA